MTQTPGISTGTEVVAHQVPAPRTRSAKRPLKMVGAGLVSAAMVGVFALPAYATPLAATKDDARAFYAQMLTTDSVSAVQVPGEISGAEEIPVEVVPAANDESEAPVAASYSVDIPAGEGAQGIVNAALAQVGQPWPQDCTDLVQNSLAAIGMVTRRDQGGPDLGIESFLNYGTLVTSGEYAPGDIIGWYGVHVAVYIGNGMAVHGGWNYDADDTVIDSAFHYGPPDFVVRVG